MTEPGPRSLSRRDVLLAGAGACWAAGCARPGPAVGSSTMTVTCIIRYQIDPFQRDGFRQYAENWASIIPRCGGRLIGYFLPYEGTNDVAWGLIAFDDLASYERYRVRLKADPDARANLAMALKNRLILREERNFVEVAAGTLQVAERRS